MFIGHFAPAFAAAALGPRAPGLGTAFLAAQLVDWAFFALAIFGIEKLRIEPGATAMVPLDLFYMPYTHSLLGCAIWAAAFALIVALSRRNVYAGLLAGLVVLSHWPLDVVAHAPDLTIAGGEGRFGLGLWNYPALLIPLEIGLVLAGFFFYMRRTRGPAAPPIILLFTLLGFQAINWFGPQATVLTLGTLIQPLVAFAVLTIIAAWVTENRYFVRRGGLATPAL